MKVLNDIWDFFASVKLALFTLSSLAITSIAGTIIPQGESSGFYIQNYGSKLARFIDILNFSDMYHSWWFLGLLGLLCTNLIICSIERLPRVLRIINADNTNVSVERVTSMSKCMSWTISHSQLSTLSLETRIKKGGFGLTRVEKDGNTLLFGEKGRWSRLGVYVVHLSILVIFAGAIIGNLTGFKGSVMLPELKSTSRIFAYGDSTPIDLGFEVRCDSFGIEFYPNTMPKEYRSTLTILEDGKEILSKDIEVNSPLTYKGITFYQSSYQGYRDFIIGIKKQGSEKSRLFSIPFQTKESWEEEQLQFGIINAKAIDQRVVSGKLWLKSGDSNASTHWLDDNVEQTIETKAGTYLITVKQRYATGLQVSKDPGVYIVYLGCFLMLLGLFMAFFMSHNRVWCMIAPKDNTKIDIYLAGSSNKNRIGMTRFLQSVEQGLNATLDDKE